MEVWTDALGLREMQVAGRESRRGGHSVEFFGL